MRELKRQGDVLLVPVAKVPAGCEVKERGKSGGRIVLALGEATGHAHAVLVKDLDLELLVKGDRRFLTVAGGSTELVHEEHGAVVLQPGAYQVVQQREYAPEEIRNVAD